jgi:endogenous inhibitor of DNA gyrase (YacG/DUF329 family)
MEATCARCAQPFSTSSRRARFCSPKCRTAATRARAKGEPEMLAVPAKPKKVRKPKASDSPIGTLGAVRTELTEAGRLDSSAGQAALALAHRIDEGAESSAGLAALTRELRAAMTEALANVTQAGDALDELRARREARRAV